MPSTGNNGSPKPPFFNASQRVIHAFKIFGQNTPNMIVDLGIIMAVNTAIKDEYLKRRRNWKTYYRANPQKLSFNDAERFYKAGLLTELFLMMPIAQPQSGELLTIGSRGGGALLPEVQKRLSIDIALFLGLTELNYGGTVSSEEFENNHCFRSFSRCFTLGPLTPGEWTILIKVMNHLHGLSLEKRGLVVFPDRLDLSLK